MEDEIKRRRRLAFGPSKVVVAIGIRDFEDKALARSRHDAQHTAVPAMGCSVGADPLGGGVLRLQVVTNLALQPAASHPASI